MTKMSSIWSLMMSCLSVARAERHQLDVLSKDKSSAKDDVSGRHSDEMMIFAIPISYAAFEIGVLGAFDDGLQ